MVSICLRPLLILLALSAGLAAAEMSPAEIEALLQKIPAGQARSLDFQETKKMRLLKDPVVTEGKLTVAPPGKVRREIRKPSPSLSVSDGATLWLYYPEFAEAEKYDLSKNSPISKMIEAITASFDLGKLRELFDLRGERLTDGYALTLQPRNSALRKNVRELRLSLSPELKLARSRLIGKDGSETVTVYRNEKILPPAAGTFTFTPPPGVKVTEPLR
ncbi:MAG TPA: outer membrane lipoprotein carrier protein LolA [Chthoniobacterales bacterium]